MKKLLLMLALCGGMLTANAQREAGTLTLKPMVGITASTLTSVDDSKTKVGGAAGVEFEYQASDKFSVTAGAIYSMQGADGENGNKINLEYINVPILANYYVAKGFAIKAGIQPGFKTKGKMESSGIEIDIPDMKSVDFSIPVGLSYEFSDFVIDARYQFGLTKVSDFEEDSKVKNSVFMLTVGYKFEL